ncbi:MAG: hypothetical protein CFE26_21960 [Verrucomicrobiales bacterium VVV1]|nr:MAG: hypothetical protein CFE26_21960 [Verrucomicrobiales bacterium VVV1]
MKNRLIIEELGDSGVGEFAFERGDGAIEGLGGFNPLRDDVWAFAMVSPQVAPPAMLPGSSVTSTRKPDPTCSSD